MKLDEILLFEKVYTWYEFGIKKIPVFLNPSRKELISYQMRNKDCQDNGFRGLLSSTKFIVGDSMYYNHMDLPWSKDWKDRFEELIFNPNPAILSLWVRCYGNPIDPIGDIDLNFINDYQNKIINNPLFKLAFVNNPKIFHIEFNEYDNVWDVLNNNWLYH